MTSLELLLFVFVTVMTDPHVEALFGLTGPVSLALQLGALGRGRTTGAG